VLQTENHFRSRRSPNRRDANASPLPLLRFPKSGSWIPSWVPRYEILPGQLSCHWRKQRDGQ